MQDYVNGDRNRVSLYFESLFHFEICLAQMWQSYNQTMSFEQRITGNKKTIFIKGDNSPYERLNKLYNYSRYLGDHTPKDLISPMWLTNSGLEAKNIDVSFNELADMLNEIGHYADKLSHPDRPVKRTEAD